MAELEIDYWVKFGGIRLFPYLKCKPTLDEEEITPRIKYERMCAVEEYKYEQDRLNSIFLPIYEEEQILRLGCASHFY